MARGGFWNSFNEGWKAVDPAAQRLSQHWEEQDVAEAYKKGSTQETRTESSFGAVDPNAVYSGEGADGAMTNAEAASYGIMAPETQTRQYGLGGKWQDKEFSPQDRRAGGYQGVADFYREKGKITKALDFEDRMDAQKLRGLQMRNQEEELANAPIKRKGLELGNQLTQSQVDLAPTITNKAKLENEAAQLKHDWSKARMGGLPGMMQFYDTRVQDGFKSTMKKNPDGSVTLLRIPEAGGQPQVVNTFKTNADNGLTGEQQAAMYLDGLMGDDKTVLSIAQMNLTASLKRSQDATTRAMYGARHAPQVYNDSQGVVQYDPNMKRFLDIKGNVITDEARISNLLKVGTPPRTTGVGNKLSQMTTDEALKLKADWTEHWNNKLRDPEFAKLYKKDPKGTRAMEREAYLTELFGVGNVRGEEPGSGAPASPGGINYNVAPPALPAGKKTGGSVDSGNQNDPRNGGPAAPDAYSQAAQQANQNILRGLGGVYSDTVDYWTPDVYKFGQPGRRLYPE